MKKVLCFILIAASLMFTGCATSGGEKIYTAEIYVSCHTVLDNMDKLDSSLHEFVPDDGVLLEKTEVGVAEKQTLYKLIVDTLRDNKIHCDVHKPTKYIKGINHLYEKSCGGSSGWVLIVNEKFLTVGAGSYLVKDGDKIQVLYTCEKGDLGYEIPF